MIDMDSSIRRLFDEGKITAPRRVRQGDRQGSIQRRPERWFILIGAAKKREIKNFEFQMKNENRARGARHLNS